MRFKTKIDKDWLAEITRKLNKTFDDIERDKIVLDKATLRHWVVLLGTSGQGTKQTVKAEIEALLASEEAQK